MLKHHVKLRRKERDYLESLIARGKMSAKMFKRATGLLELERGKTLQAVAETLGVNNDTVAAWREHYQVHGLPCLADAPRAGRPLEIDGGQRAKVTALACSEAPAGHARGSLRLLADKGIELGYGKRISYVQVDKILKKTRGSPICTRRGVLARLTPSSLLTWSDYCGSMRCPMSRCSQWWVLMSVRVF
jgi:transposase